MPELTTRVYENFRDYLAARFSNTAAIRTFVCSPPISIAEADFPREGSARDAWQVILTRAQTHNKYALLVQQTILGFEPDRAVIEAYAAEWEAAAPARPPEVNLANPYPGLKSFEEKDHDYFFGREQWVRDITAELGRHAFFCLYGGSGSGKSSLLGAGVIPRWKRETGGTVIHFTPGMDPFASLLSMGLRNDSDAETVVTDAKAGKRTDLFQELHRRLGQGSQMLVVMDQAEQLFTRTTDKEMRKRFLACLFAPLPDGVHILIGMRNDYLDVWNTVLPAHLTQHELLRPPTKAEVRDIVIEPARKHHAFFEAAMAKELLDRLRNLEGSSPLPLLQFLLKQLWAQSPPKDGILRFEAYQALGGVDGALRKHIENFIREHPGREADIHNILLALVRFEEREGKYLAFAKSAPRSGLPQDLVDALLSERWRLLTTSHEPGHIEFAHEVVMSAWPGFDAFKAQHGTILAIRSDIIEDTHEWEKAETRRAKQQALWTGIRLERALMHAALGPYEKQVDQFALAGTPLTKDERDFLLAGVDQRKQLLLAKAIQMATMMFLTFISVLMVGLTMLGQTKLGEKAEELEKANKQTNAVLAGASWQVGREYRGDPYKTIKPSSILATHHLLRSASSYEKAGDITARNHALLAAKVTSADLCFTVPVKGTILGIRTSDGKQELLGVNESGEEIFAIQLPEGGTRQGPKMAEPIDRSRYVVMSKDGRRILNWRDHKMTIIDTVTGLALGEPFSLPGPVVRAAFSADNAQLLCWDDTGRVHLRNGETGALLAVLNNSGETKSALFVPKNTTILTWGDEDPIPRLWDQKGKPIGPQSHVPAVPFSTRQSDEREKDEDKLTKERESLLQKIKQGTADERGEQAIFIRTGRSGLPRVMGAVLGPLGEQFASWDDDAQLFIWSASDGRRLASMDLGTVEGGIRDAVFDDTGTHLLIWNSVGSVWIAECEDARRLDSPWRAKQAQVKHPELTGAAFVPQSEAIITWGYDGSMKYWPDAEALVPFSYQRNEFREKADEVQFNPEATAILSRSHGGTADLWEVDLGAPIARGIEHLLSMEGAAFCADNQHIVTWGDHWTNARVWRPNNLMRDHPTGFALPEEWNSKAPEEYHIISDIKKRERLQASSGLSGERVDAWVSPDGRHVLSRRSFDFILNRWSKETGEKVGKPLDLNVGSGHFVIATNRGSSPKVGFSPDGELVMCVNLSVVRLWDSAKSELIAAFSILPFIDAVFSKDGKSIIIKDEADQRKIIDIDFPSEIPVSRYILEFEVRSATLLGNDGELRMLTPEEWEQKRKELEALKGK